MALVNNLEELKNLLEILNSSGVKVFKSGELQLVLDFEPTVDENDEELDEKPQIGFGSADLRGLGVSTEFDE